MAEGVRVAMWSGPRNLSTALMRSFGNRTDVEHVRDEPFYAAYLAATGKNHPMRDAILAAQPTDYEEVARGCATDPVAPGRVAYQKHMTQHILPGTALTWMDALVHGFLVRSPERVVASYAKRREGFLREDLGFARQRVLFDHVCDRVGRAPPVIDAEDLRADPERVLRALCTALGLPFEARMLTWPAGPRASDGVWARHWYGAVLGSTGFAPPDDGPPGIDDALRGLAEALRPDYDALARHRIRAEGDET